MRLPPIAGCDARASRRIEHRFIIRTIQLAFGTMAAAVLSALLAAGANAQENMCTRLAGFIERSGGELSAGWIAGEIAGLPGSPLALGPVPGVLLKNSGNDAKRCKDRLVLETVTGRRAFRQPYGDRGPEDGWCPVVEVASMDGQPVLVEGRYHDLTLVPIRSEARRQDELYGPACGITVRLTPSAKGLDGRCEGPACHELAALAQEVSASPVQQHLEIPTDPAMERADTRWPAWLRRGRALAAAHLADWARLAADGEALVRMYGGVRGFGWPGQLESYAWFHPVDLMGTLGLLAQGPLRSTRGEIEVLVFVRRDGDRPAVVASYELVDTRYAVEVIGVKALPYPTASPNR